MFNNLKQERKHLIIVKQYHKADFNLIWCKEKKDYKRDFKGRKKGLFGSHFRGANTF